jgi:alpha-tubulin suppressor-like RCC1 family protein
MNLVFSSALRKNRPKKNAKLITAGVNSTLAIQTTGRVVGWGRNDSGQLGDNSTASRTTPVNLAGALKTFCNISASLDSLFSAAIDKNGRVWAWGTNGNAQLGDNTLTQRLTPVSVLGAVKTFCKIQAANGFCLAIAKNGRLWGWGNNGNGQLGDNTTVSKRTPISILGAVKTFCQISAGAFHSVGIDKNGRAWSWGLNSNAQIGDNTLTQRLTPVSVLGAVKTFCQISCGQYFSLAIAKNGRAWGWGYNGKGQLGDNTVNQRLTPVSVTGAVKTFCKISAGYRHCMAIDKNGRAWGWGYNSNGQLGDNSETSRRTPVSVAGAVKTFCEISAGNDHSVAIDKYNIAWAWGQTNYGQLGINHIGLVLTPVSILGAAKTFCTLADGTGYHNSFAIDKAGKIWSWGSTYLGTVSQDIKFTPVQIEGANKTFCKIAGGFQINLAIDKNGKVWGWGANGNGQIGDNSTTTRSTTPVSVAGAVKTFCEISMGGRHSLAIDKNGRAWGWGYNGQGQLGDNTLVSKRTPVSILGTVKTFCKIFGPTDDGLYSLAIDKNGRVWGWGENGVGNLGDGTTVSKRTPVAISGPLRTFCQISGGQGHTLAIDKNGRAWAWGFNAIGQLGDNSVTSRLAPVSVLGAVKTFCKIMGAANSSFAIDKYGKIWAWGQNSFGQFGDNTTTSRRTPVRVCGSQTFCHISASRYVCLAIDKNGKVWNWGTGGFGNLADGGVNYAKKYTPVRVCNI